MTNRNLKNVVLSPRGNRAPIIVPLIIGAGLLLSYWTKQNWIMYAGLTMGLAFLRTGTINQKNNKKSKDAYSLIVGLAFVVTSGLFLLWPSFNKLVGYS
jgi:hypothetical protein